ncbi:hypothetical protein [Pseudoduganella buxea]|uniref:Uncharacterized protein n=2 Tax=Pseudoduganella buxea TaxID=1949069 RepID=A0ABQ1KUP9_9BURK|nr:hypothetical protein [Pseudoduganella buxea]GGC06898.1 hypothetical protein GCM10011572_30730 [Pseudoduganella buxea]
MQRRTLLALVMLGLSIAAVPARADERVFPPEAKRGRMTPGYFPDITLDGKARRLSPAARIFNQDNLVEVPAALRGSDIVVNYTQNADGDIDRVWLLTPDEARQKPRQR